MSFLEGEKYGVMFLENFSHLSGKNVKRMMLLSIILKIETLLIVRFSLGSSTLQFLSFTIYLPSLGLQKLPEIF
jgi:hypothetical protein